MFLHKVFESNLLQCPQLVTLMGGLVLNSKKLEPHCRLYHSLLQSIALNEYIKTLRNCRNQTVSKQYSFLGMMIYMGNFIPYLSYHTEHPVRAILKKEALIYRDKQINQSIQEIKYLLRKA